VESAVNNFIYSYKPPSDQNEDYIGHLESLLLNHLDPTQPLFIVGDLNMNLLTPTGDELKEFMMNNALRNSVRTATRTATNF
jgi:hypothetical protein